MSCSLALSVWNSFILQSNTNCSRAKALMITFEASLFVFMGSVIMKPVPASHSSCKYLLPWISSCEIGPVVSEDIASNGSYLLPVVFLNGRLFDFSVMHESHETFL